MMQTHFRLRRFLAGESPQACEMSGARMMNAADQRVEPPERAVRWWNRDAKAFG